MYIVNSPRAPRGPSPSPEPRPAAGGPVGPPPSAGAHLPPPPDMRLEVRCGRGPAAALNSVSMFVSWVESLNLRGTFGKAVERLASARAGCPCRGTALHYTVHTYCTALYCNVLHCHCTALYSTVTAMYCSALQFTALHCTPLRLHCSLHRSWHYMYSHPRSLHLSGVHCTALHNTVQHCTALYSLKLTRPVRRAI
jgi:hypothetical protein